MPPCYYWRRLALFASPRITLVSFAKVSARPPTISNIVRPGSPVRAVIIAFGLGLSVLVTVSVSESNLGRQIDARVTDDAPAWFFIDIQPHQIERFESLVGGIDGITKIAKTPMLRGRSTVGRHTSKH